MATMKTAAFAYLRVSGKGQISGDGFTRQLDAINRYARSNGIQIARVFREMGVTGTKPGEDRAAFAEMMTALHANGTKLVIVEKLDRLARDLMIQESIIADLRANGFQLISVAEPDLLQDDPGRTMFRQFMGAIAQYDKTSIVLKLRGARQRMKESTGRCEGRKPYGDRDGEVAIIERMRQLRSTGMAYHGIAMALNADGIPTRTSGSLWRGCTVNAILNRRVNRIH
jgi:DNA invertase Pin-like site-specific DNA recombinase